MNQVHHNSHALDVVRLGDVQYQVPEPGVLRHVDARSAAVEVMTDLHRVPAATIPPTMPLDKVRQAMVLRGVRMLLVVDEQRAVKGLVTTHDLLGERPVAVSQARGLKPAELTVADIMIPVESIEAFTLRDVLKASVGDVIHALRHIGRQHALVIERDEPGTAPAVRGIFSASQIARQMGIPPFVGDVAKTFAEIEAVIGA
ncbi:CBS domain-containing protein [Nitrogeniibacter mangrovi]|uniref:CBS domain-containing protein n=1 Tax=Nitrogeniibacter mangrovi TaxID=2016596 RepID=A0A6C1B6R7_9RHOO|nr:CBS domain-containing protein [Nitrogeniibacter mangrovi]QID19147.1 CBS domain-containing protein [Nitrogeniibacter mangrovi]